MSIDNVTDLSAAYPRQAVIRKGGPKKKVWSEKYNKDIWVVGDDLDHFRFDKAKPEVMAKFKEVYGDEPREINVYLPFGTKDQNFDAWMKEYGAGGLKVKCTRPENREGGIVLWQDGNGMFQTEPRPCQWPNCGCKPTSVLMVIVPELVPVAGIGAVWVLTKAWNDCVELSRNLAAAEQTANSLGRDLRGIPFILSRRLDDVSCPPRKGSNGKRVRDEKWLLHIEPHPAWVAEQMEASKRLASPLNAPALAAPQPSPFDEVFADDEEGEGEGDIEYPETEIIDDEPESLPANGNGRKFHKPDFIARIQELMTEAENLGHPKNYDQGVLDEASIDELKRIGAELRAHIDSLAEQTEIPF